MRVPWLNATYYVRQGTHLAAIVYPAVWEGGGGGGKKEDEWV